MDNITYLIGAGASADCLPIIDKIPERIAELIKVLTSDKYQLSGMYPDVKDRSILDLQLLMIKDLEWLLERSSKHSSIDTFAKKLYLKDAKEELSKLKFTISVFFVLEQLIKIPDMRYDTFFASILNDGLRNFNFPENIKIVSWNYDYQFEISYSEFSDQPHFDIIQGALNIHSKFQDKLSNGTGFGIYKLNGSIGYQNHASNNFNYFVQSHKDELTKNDLEQIIYLYALGVYQEFFEKKLPIISTLSFAWEKENSSQIGIINRVLATIKETTILIIIGYSFPYFNREVDRTILNSLSKLKKVYFQSLEDTNVLTSRFRSVYYKPISDENMMKIADIKQFYLPPEL